MKKSNISKDEIIQLLIKSKKETQEEIKNNASNPIYIDAMNKLRLLNNF